MSAAQTPPGGSTPNSRFISQSQSAEELLKEQTLGLVHLSDFRKRKADAFDRTTQSESIEPGVKTTIFKKKKKGLKTGGLSFDDHADRDDNDVVRSEATTQPGTPASNDDLDVAENRDSMVFKKKLKPNTGVSFIPKSHSKSALAREAQLKETLTKQYMQRLERIRATEFLLPFVFFDGKNTTGGKVRMKKGDQIWLFLERARKVGAESAGKMNGARKDWARISVDDLMLVRQDLIIPAHYDFLHLIQNQAKGYHGTLFSLSADPTAATPNTIDQSPDAPTLTTASGPILPPGPRLRDEDLEGFSDDPAPTRVVDRRWYERNKHIYPASLWEDFDMQKDYSKGGRKDREGNQMFFS